MQELRETVQGRVLAPRDDAYTEAARIWNGAFDGRRPALVVQCTGVADVIAALGFARSNDLPLAVRGGGHSIAGFSTTEGGVVIDLSPMRRPRRPRGDDRQRRRRRDVGRRRPRDPGARAGDDRRTRVHDRRRRIHARRRHRLADAQARPRVRQPRRRRCRHRRGRLVHASETENEDLLWGLRGGGGNFGIVTQFESRVHPVGPMVYAGPIFYPAAVSRDLLRAFRSWAPRLRTRSRRSST